MRSTDIDRNGPCVGLIIVGLTLFILSPLHAQINKATLLGAVTDKSGAVVPAAQVVLTNVDTGMRHTTSSSPDGEYTIPNVDPGHYTLTVSHPGFSPFAVSDLVLQVGQRATENVILQVGSSTQRVTVTSTAPLLSTSSAEVSQIVTPTEVANLPLNGRQFWQLTQLTPGATYIPGGQGTRTGGTSIRARAVNVTINGVSAIWTGWSLDGTNITEFELGGTLLQPNVDALEEFRVESADMPAQYGHTPTMVNASLKSGTNQFHGDVFDYLRNDVTDARNFFAVPPPGSTRSVEPLKRNQFGATFGGPIKHDRVFFFSDYQGTRLRQGSVFNSVVPSAAERQGDFSQLLLGSKPQTIKNPSDYTPFRGNVIPTGAISSQAQFLLSYLPLPNFLQGSTSRAVFTNSVLQDQDEGDIKVDANMTSKDRIMDRYSIADNREDDPNPFPRLAFFSLHSRVQDETLQWTRLISPSWINVAQFGYYRSIFLFGGTLQGTNIAQEAGIQGFDNPVIVPVPSFPQINMSAFSGFAGSPSDQRPKSNRIRTWEYTDTVSYAQGKHDIMMGGEWFHRTDGFFNGQNSVGVFNFVGTYSGNGFADFLLGVPDNVTRDAYRTLYGESGDFRALFFQDDYRVRPNLTLNLGVRWEDNPFFNGTRAEISGFDPATGKVVVPSLVQSSANLSAQPLESTLLPLFQDRIEFTSVAGLPESIRPAERRDWAPRLGFAWSPKQIADTVFRGAYGVFYAFPDTNNLGNTVGTVPFIAEQSLFNDRPPAFPTRTFGNFFQGAPFAVANPNPGQPCSFGFAALSCSTPNVGSAPINAHQTYVSEWNFSVQRQLTSRMSLDAAYVGSRSMHLQTQQSINNPTPGPGSIQARRPLPQWGTISMDSFEGAGTYNALQTKFEFRGWHGLSLLGSYTYSKCMDNGSNEGGPTVALIPAFWAVCDFDLTHSGVISYYYSLPVGVGRRFLSEPGIANRILGDWSISGITTLQSGLPFTPTISFDAANTGVGGQWPNRIAPPLVLGNVSCWFYTSANSSCRALAPNAQDAFVSPVAYTYGNGGRNTLRADRLTQFDFALLKNVALSESKYLQFRAEAFNLFNHPVFSAPSTSVNTSSGGQVGSTLNSARLFEFTLKLLF